ncbi:MAG: hypothetical protein PHH67_04765 [Methanosarcina sp.]|jgi:uncharacterized membrane protein|nr:hypothetical protein [Methanosarcina sp.]MDD3316752.1 hypothetical protein [Methanosarcina sp.]MDD4305812.1 hypothetical protein [Methanosarcina sp.]
MISLEHPEMLFLIIPVIIVGFYLLRKTKTKLVEWRMLVAFLLVLALASPFTTVTQTISEEDPSLVLVQDQTSSMGLFPEEAGSELYKALVANTPTTLVQLTGDKTSLGDTIMQYAGGSNQIILVSDGNSNAGKDLPEALEFAKETDTPVYLVQPELKANDLSVEVLGDKTVVVDNQNEFEIVVRQASNQNVSYFLEVFVDGQLSQSKDFTLEGRNNIDDPIKINQAFNTLGAHNIRVKITPHEGDINSQNNEFSKGIYVIPKPKVLLITNEPDSPLSQILSELYEVSIERELPRMEVFEENKALVIDNMYITDLSENDVNNIRKYVTGGNGLIVVGGNSAYDRPLSRNYRNSSFEELLPVISKPSDWKGGRDVVIIIDLTGSLAGGPSKGGGYASPETVEYYQKLTKSEKLARELAEKTAEAERGRAEIAASRRVNVPVSIANSIVEAQNLKDAQLLVLTFKDEVDYLTRDFVDLNLETNRDQIKDELQNLTTGGTRNSLDLALNEAEKKIMDRGRIRADVFIISDGGLADGTIFRNSLNTIEVLEDTGTNFYFIHVFPDEYDAKQLDSSGNFYAEELMKAVNGTYLKIENKSVYGVNIEFEESQNYLHEDIEEKPSGPSKLIKISPDHFITKNVNITGNVTGYNDVTPKGGAERLVITTTGKPVLTTWRFGLGRVAAFTTDNGEGEGSRWASALYSGSSAKLISSTTNWAIGNPRAEEGAVLDGPDTWLGTPSDLTLTMYDKGIPELKLDGSSLDLALTGRNIYEASVNPETIGIHDLSGYPLAVNYQLEYRDVGLNEDIESLIAATGGKIYTEKDARALLLKDARQNSERQSDEPVSLKVYVLLAALVLYLGEIIARRIKEMNKLKNAQVEAETRV